MICGVGVTLVDPVFVHPLINRVPSIRNVRPPIIRRFFIFPHFQLINYILIYLSSCRAVPCPALRQNHAHAFLQAFLCAEVWEGSGYTKGIIVLLYKPVGCLVIVAYSGKTMDPLQ
jgi:hypothetical protein